MSDLERIDKMTGLMDTMLGDWRKNDVAFIWRACHSKGTKAFDTKLSRSRTSRGIF